MFSKLFPQHRKLAIVISILMVLGGILFLLRMPLPEFVKENLYKRDYPWLFPPSVTMHVTYAGASNMEVAKEVAYPVERQLIGMKDLKRFYSTCCNNGSYSLTLIFDEGTNVNMALKNVTKVIKDVESKLPAEIKRTSYTVDKPSRGMLNSICFTCDGVMISGIELGAWMHTKVKDAVCQVDGVAGVDIFPPGNYSMRVWMNTTRMNALNITPQDVRDAINAQNIQAADGAAGSVPETVHATFKVTATNSLTLAKQLNDIIVKRGENGQVTHLRDIAKIELGPVLNSGFSRLNGASCAAMRIAYEDDADTMATLLKVHECLRAIEIPEDVEWTGVPSEAIPAGTSDFFTYIYLMTSRERE